MDLMCVFWNLVPEDQYEMYIDSRLTRMTW
jgi:hypothetical protein